MALIAMAVYNTNENERYKETLKTMESLNQQVNWSVHRLVVIVNGPTDKLTRNILDSFSKEVNRSTGPFFPLMAQRLSIIELPENIGTARAINRAWAQRVPGEVCIKMDNDVVINQPDWPDLLEEVFHRDTDKRFGICGLKRKDLLEDPYRNDWYRSELVMLPHEPGERWVIVEKVNHVMGTCQAYRPELLDKIGYLTQMGALYGFDDSLAAIRALAAGFHSCFLPWVDIDHIDHNEPKYIEWKLGIASQYMDRYNQLKFQYLRHEIPVRCDIDGNPIDNFGEQVNA